MEVLNASVWQKTIFNGNIYYITSEGTVGGLYQLWKCDLNGAGIESLETIGVVGNEFPSLGVGSNNLLYFKGLNAQNGLDDQELWVTDGTQQGTVLLKDINFGPTSSEIRNFINHNGEVYFVANNGTSGEEIWTSDGTENGTIMVDDQLSQYFEPRELTSLDDDLIFQAGDLSTIGSELYILSSTPTSINKDSKIDQFAFYPNPTTGNIRLDLGRTAEHLTLNVLNAHGSINPHRTTD